MEMHHGVHPDLHALLVPIDSLVRDPKNARVHDERNILAVMESYRAHGQRKPLVVKLPERTIEAGNGQVEAALRLGWTHIAIVGVYESEHEAKKFALRDNRSAELAGWDQRQLSEDLHGLKEIGEDLDLIGWNEAEATPLLAAWGDDGYKAPLDRDEHYTPSEVIEDARHVLGGIDLDPASCEHANRIVRATTFYTKETDGLVRPWSGRTWMNPPYSHPLVAKFIDRFIEHRDSGVITGIVLCNSATDTDWCQRMISKYPACFTDGRLAFYRQDAEAQKNNRVGQAIFYGGDDVRSFVGRFEKYGQVVVPYGARRKRK